MPLIGLGMPELLVIAAVVILLFGANKLPKLGGAIGESIKNFKKGIKDTDAVDSKELPSANERSSTNKVDESK